MNRLVEVDPQDKGILVSKSELIVVNGGACDFYTISLAERVETPVVISIRATYGEVTVCPDTLQIKPEEYNKLRRIVVVGYGSRDNSCKAAAWSVIRLSPLRPRMLQVFSGCLRSAACD